MYDKETTV